MRSFREDHPTLSAFAIILVIAGIVMAFRLSSGLAVIWAAVSILFVIVMGWWLYSRWREHRDEISYWPAPARWAFYGAFLVLIVNIGVYYGSALASHGLKINGLTGVAWLLVFPLCGYTIWRVWRDQHTYS